MTRFVWLAAVATAAVMAAAPSPARAFCGFYVDAGGAEMFNDATQVVLMRDGTRTVLAMQNDYDGPVADFALVVPVPAVLHDGDVVTLPKSLFAKVNGMSAPRLVEYWEQDPCEVADDDDRSVDVRSFAKHASSDSAADYGVKVEAQFDVDEYKVVILSATDSTGLDRYLRDQHYKIPPAAAPLLRPYVESGMKFFVAKVDPKKVKFEHGKAVLSPLRFFYDSEDFSLPIRLGLANSSGTQDLIIDVFGVDQRYEVANYPNVFIPTNLDVVDAVRTRFGEFYGALFDRTVQEHPGAVVTEYAWAASSCDPCPGPRLQAGDMAKLGEEVLAKHDPGDPDGDDVPEPRSFVLTRLHARYGTGGAPNDLVFRAAAPVVGGREQRDAHGVLTRSVTPSGTNAFQARYAIRHPWAGAVTCAAPRRGVWGPNPDGGGGRAGRRSIAAATDSASAPRGAVELQDLVAEDVPEIAVQRGIALSPPLPMAPQRRTRAQGCGCASGADRRGAPTSGALATLVVAFALARRRVQRLNKCPKIPG